MSRSKNRTAPETSGKPRRRKWTLRALTTVVATTGALVSLAGPAQAYDSRTCFAALPIAVSDIDQFKMKTGIVDFGDGWHLGGSPVGDAVVCWGGGAGDVSITGKLYADSPTAINAGVDVRYFRTDGSYNTSQRHIFLGSNGESSGISFTMPGAAAVDRVRIRLWTCVPTPSGAADCNLVNAVTFHRGDVNFE